MELRDVGLLKLAFAGELQPAELRHVASDHVEAWSALHAELVSTMSGPSAGYVIAMAAAATSFWQEMRDSLPAQDVQAVAV